MALLLMTTKGTPFIYYGEEIGMKNGRIPRSRIKDPLGKKLWPFYKGRDGARTPMQWNDSPYAGFSSTEPWLPFNNDYLDKNVESQKKDPASLLNLYRQLISLRRECPALCGGNWMADRDGEKGKFSYTRKQGNEHIHIILNFTTAQKKYYRKFSMNEKKIFSTIPGAGNLVNDGYYVLQPYEGVITKKELIY